MFLIKPITNQQLWNRFLAETKPPTFLQSWAWGEFNQAMGDKIFRLGIYAGEKLIALALIIKIKARRGSFLFCPHYYQFKVADANGKNVLQKLKDYLINLAKEEKCSFIRISPLLANTPSNQKIFQTLGFKPAPIYMHPEIAWMKDLKNEPDSLLAEMRKTHRNLIRRAQKEGVEIIAGANPDYLKIFYQLYLETANRQKFTPFSRHYLRQEFKIFSQKNKALIFLARWRNNYLSSAIIIFDTNSAFYHQGASSFRFPKIPASYLLHWQAMLEAKKRGCSFYNFWGIAPVGQKNHPWAGLTLFKRGFGGFKREYLPAQDLILKPAYWLTYVIEKIRKWRRGV